MRKVKIIFILFIFLIIYVYVVGISYIPNSIVVLQGEKINISTLWGVNVNTINNTNPNVGNYNANKILQTSGDTQQEAITEVGKINLNISLFNNVNLKDITVNVVPKTKVIPLGNSIGLKLYTKGVLVVGMSEIDGKKPYENTGIEEGDTIIAVDNIELTSAEDLIEKVNKSNGNEVIIKYVGSKGEKQVSMIPAKTKDNEYKLGLWVRDAAARSWNSIILCTRN